ncbi:hypothetical protein ACFP9V_00595 [Deinococcus radiopugnans]|uniref:Uncharacterized protein n=1 Tax=Deinococcus radiopugnans ATCC 19172 TaxID=585398 RepID=A0A5C4Y8M9_9DEIO|nr:hypothetical protein [Deinococcus radiopugnans]MBB6016903.1 hypothetical protein [Deinococcus radiopugnans ATCC 19172]TNM71824.1 hypothetical protein FHR04_05455 [Deinococcus radiopugnans ATCC 19172]
MNVTRHFSDTRTDQGRVRFLLASGRVCLMAEGPGWTHRSAHDTLADAATFLALLPGLEGGLYRQALDDLEHQLAFERGYLGAA